MHNSSLNVLMRLFLSNLLFVLLSNSSLISQTNRYLSLELGGSGGLYSFNIEKSVLKTKPKHFQWHYGCSVLPSSGRINFVLPIGVSYLIGKQQHMAEFGIGQGLAIVWDYTWHWVHTFPRATGMIAYRWNSSDQKYFFRLAYTPLISYIVDFQYQHWFGVTAAVKLK